MKYFIYLLFFLLLSNAFSQTMSFSEWLEYDMAPRKLSISPNGTVWLIAPNSNKVDSTVRIKNSEKSGPIKSASKDFFALEKISFFNNDTAIMTGSISVADAQGNSGGFYFTSDAGKSWVLRKFGGQGRVTKACTFASGHAWLACANGNIYYSNNFGSAWRVLKLSVKSGSQFNDLVMLDSVSGVAVLNDKELYATIDNWKTCKRIQAPLDQKLYGNKSKEQSSSIIKIVQWQNRIIVNQGGRYYYTDSSRLNWYSFPFSVSNCVWDNSSGKLFVVDSVRNVYEFVSPTIFTAIAKGLIEQPYSSIQAMNGSLYATANSFNVYKVDRHGACPISLWDTRGDVKSPVWYYFAGNLVWGVSSNQIYISDSLQKNWSKILAIDNSISGFTMLNNATALWHDKRINNFSYSLSGDSVASYHHVTPLAKFLSSPIKTMQVEKSSRGCFYDSGSDLLYNAEGDSVLVISTAWETEDFDKKKVLFNKRIPMKSVVEVLNAINSNPEFIPTVKDFNITAQDKQDYLSLIDSICSDKSPWKNVEMPSNAFYKSMLNKLDTLSEAVVVAVINAEEGLRSTSYHTDMVAITNLRGDTLRFSRYYCNTANPWNLPWSLNCGNATIRCNSVDFSRLVVAASKPENSAWSFYKNSFLLQKIAEYLWSMEHPENTLDLH